MPDRPDDQVKQPRPDEPGKTGDDAPPAGESEAVNDPPANEDPGDDEETMPVEEGFSIVP